jgi:phage terminase small subunit
MIRTHRLRRARFVQEYAKDLNAMKAAIRAGYSPKTAKDQGSRLLRDPKIRAQVDALLVKLTKTNEVTVERVLREIARIAFGDIRKLFDDKGNLRPIHELDDDSAALIASVETEEIYAGTGKERQSVGLARKVKQWDKGKALDLCMAYLGLGMHNTRDPAEGGGLSLTINLSRSGRDRHEPND